MNARTLCLGLGLLLASPPLSAQQRDPAVLLEAARYEAQVRGDFQAAIRLLESLVESSGVRRDVLAKVLVELGSAYEVVGRDGAREAYSRVISEFADQRESAQMARTRLAALTAASPAAAPTEGFRLRRLWSTTAPVEIGGLSPDGRQIAFIDWVGPRAVVRGHADVALYDTRDARARLVTDRPSLTEVDVYPSTPIWSGDGRWMAYSLWAVGWTHRELHVVRPDGSADRIVLDNRQMSDVRPVAFASSGDFVVALLRGWDEIWRLGLVSLKDRPLVILKTLGAQAPSSASLSPDDRFVAYPLRASESTPSRDIFVLAVDGSSEVRVASHASDDSAPFWTPDGERIAFVSDRSGAAALWAVRWRSGPASDEPELVHANLGAMQLLGITGSGAPYFSVTRSESEVYTARLDLSGSGSLTDVKRLPESHLLTNMRPAWSPDGSRVAYLSMRGAAGESVHLVVKALATGEERAFPLPFRGGDARARRADWSLDGRNLWIEGTDPSGVLPGRVSYRIDAATGELTREEYRRDFAGIAGGVLTDFGFVDGRQAAGLRDLGIRLIGQTDQELFAQGDERLRPGERALFVRNGVQRVESIEERRFVPLTPLGAMDQWRLSPDGAALALAISSDSVMTSNVLHLLSLETGSARELVRLPRAGDDAGEIRAVQWTPDGRNILYATAPTDRPDADAKIWMIDVEGGAPKHLNLPLTPYQLGNLRFHPDGQRIAYTTVERFTEVWVAEGLPW